MLNFCIFCIIQRPQIRVFVNITPTGFTADELVNKMEDISFGNALINTNVPF